MNILKFIGSALYGAIASYVIWLLFYWVTPWVMSFGWGGVVISIICGTFIAGAFMSLCSLILCPLSFMTDNNASKIIPTILMLFNGFSSARLAWGVDVDYTAPKIVLAITLTILAIVIYITAIQGIWAKRDDIEG